MDFLRDPQKFTQIGARIPHGILLVGPPGSEGAGAGPVRIFAGHLSGRKAGGPGQGNG